MQRKINAPDKEYMSAEEAAKWLDMDVQRFNDLVHRGVLRRGVPYGHRTRRWHWTTVLGMSFLMEHLLGFVDWHPPGPGETSNLDDDDTTDPEAQTGPISPPKPKRPKPE